MHSTNQRLACTIKPFTPSGFRLTSNSIPYSCLTSSCHSAPRYVPSTQTFFKFFSFSRFSANNIFAPAWSVGDYISHIAHRIQTADNLSNLVRITAVIFFEIASNCRINRVWYRFTKIKGLLF